MKNVEITDFWIKIKRVVNPEELKTLYIYPTKNADKYIFAGRYIFKGMTAERILKHFEKENFNLEQFLQNALSKKELEKLGRLYLGNLVLKYKSNLTEKENICIFAEMFLGIIAMKMDKNFIDEFVYKNFRKNEQKWKDKSKNANRLRWLSVRHRDRTLQRAPPKHPHRGAWLRPPAWTGCCGGPAGLACGFAAPCVRFQAR